MSLKPLGVGVIGCGNIATGYVQDLPTYPHLNLVGVTDIDLERARKLAAQANCRVFASVEELLANDAVDIAVNLTFQHVHKEVITQCLEAGKHVYSEKPLALTYADAQALVELAKRKNLRLGCSPFTFFGEAQQTAWKWIREGRLGTVRMAYAEVNQGRIESWHPAPLPFYQVGILYDVAVYPLTILTAICGPARRVWAYGKVIYSDRVTKSGEPFHIDVPDCIIAVVEMGDDMLVRLSANFYVNSRNSKQGSGIEFHGDAGSLTLSSWQGFNAAVEYAEYGKPFEPVWLLREPYKGTPWGRGVAEMADALLHNRPHRATGEQAAHIIDIIGCTLEAMQTSQPVAIRSSFAPPAPMEWAA